VVAADLLSGMGTSEAGYNYILVMVDHFSKFLTLAPLKTKEAREEAEAIEASWIAKLGKMATLHTDQGGEFAGEPVASLARRYGIKRSFTTAYHPQGDGVVERANRTIADMLSLSGDPRRWDEHLESVAAAYNAAPHSATGEAPYFLWFGKEAPSAATKVVAQPAPTQAQLRASAAGAKKARVILTSLNRVQMAKIRDANQAAVSFKIGDLVMVRDPAVRQAAGSKLLPSWKGPCKVLKKGKSPMTFMIQQVGGGFTGTKNVTHMKRFFPSSAPVQRSVGRGPHKKAAEPTRTAPLETLTPGQLQPPTPAPQPQAQPAQAEAPTAGVTEPEQASSVQPTADAGPSLVEEAEEEAAEDHEDYFDAVEETPGAHADQSDRAVDVSEARQPRKRFAPAHLRSGDFLLKF
jgi:hypothetical protein